MICILLLIEQLCILRGRISRRITEYILGLMGGIMGILFSIHAMYFYGNRSLYM